MCKQTNCGGVPGNDARFSAQLMLLAVRRAVYNNYAIFFYTVPKKGCEVETGTTLGCQHSFIYFCSSLPLR